MRPPLRHAWLPLAVASLAALAQARGAGPAAPRLSPDGERALRSLLDAGSHPHLAWPDFAAQRDDVARFYRDGGYALAWIHVARPTEQAVAVARLLRGASAKGLEPEDYDGPRWADRLAALDGPSPPPELEQVRFDVALTVSLVRYLSDLRFGRVEPRRVHFEIDVDEARDLHEIARQASSATDVASAVERAEPPFAAYRRTLRALEDYARLSAQDDGELLPSTRRAVRVGDLYAGAPRLARFLRLVGDLRPSREPSAESGRFDPELSEAVARFQRRHGLEPDGQLGARTVEQLNRPLSRRVAQLRLTLERWRWLPRAFPSPPIVVNIPEFRMHAGDPGQRWSMKVVVGKAYRHQTPVFAGEMKYVIFRPFWNVPLPIQRDELAPQIARDPRQLAEKGYEITDRAWRPVSAPSSSTELVALLRAGVLRIRQRPGPRNALGAVKFVFPNRHDVYLHGTPSPELFARSRRDFSHGCIRVEDPMKLAAWLLRERPGWTSGTIDRAMRGRETVQVNLPRPVPVLILYGTAFVTEDGEVRFFDDIYGHDAALERALAERRPYSN